jgi:hypothetical protein
MTSPSIVYPGRPALASDAGPLSLGTLVAGMTALFAAAALFGANTYAVGEIDVAWMIAGVVHGTLAHAPLTGPLHYGVNFSYGDYALLYLLPAQVRADPGTLALAMNAIGVVSIVAALPLTWRYLARLAGEQPAALAVAVFFFSPLVLQTSGSGHPLLPAFALAMAGALALERSPIAAVALLAASLAVRAEMALLFPLLALGGAASGFWRRTLILAAALALFFFGQRLVVPPANAGPGAILAFIAAYYDPRLLARGSALLVLGAGFATCSAMAALLVWARVPSLGARRMAIAAALIVPGLAAWLPNPQPVRHFFMVTLGIALVLAWRLGSLALSGRALALIAIGIVGANQVLAEAAYPLIVRHYDWEHPALEARRSVYWAPLGTFLRDAPARRREQEALYREALELSHATRKVPRLLVLAHNDRYLVARFIADDPSLVPRVVEEDGVSYQELASPARRIRIARLWQERPRDAALAILSSARYRGWQVYAQPTAVGTLP